MAGAEVVDRLGSEMKEDAGRMRVLSWQEMQALKPLEWLVDGLLIRRGLSLLIGHPKAGKSTLARVLAASVAGHGDGRFLGRKVRGSHRVFYYSPDEAPETTREHFLRILPPEANGIEFCARADLEDLAEYVAGEGVRLLVIDTLGALFSTMHFPEGDSYMRWQAPLDRVRQLATDTGAHICLLHHARKAEGDRSLAALGSSAIAGKADTIINVTTAKAGDSYSRFVETTQRAGDELTRRRLTLGNDGWLTVEPRLTDDAEAARHADALDLHDAGMSYREIAREIGVSRSTVHRWIKQGGKQ